MSFNRMQEKHEIILNGAGASMLGGLVRFKTFRAGNFIQATRVPHDDASPHPPAMVAAMMRPGAPSSMDVNDFHNSLGHANIKTLYETAKQMGIKLTGIPFGFRRQAFQGEVPTWGGGTITSSWPWSSTAFSPGAASDTSATAATSSRGGGTPAAVPAATTSATSSRGDYFDDIFLRRGYSRRGSSDDYFGGCGDIFPRRGYYRHGSSGGGYRWHTRKRERSWTAGGSGCGAYATRIRPFCCSRNSYRSTFSNGAGAAGDEWWA